MRPVNVIKSAFKRLIPNSPHSIECPYSELDIFSAVPLESSRHGCPRFFNTCCRKT